MQQWLSDFTLDLGNGETFKPYDPTAPKKIIDYAKGRGYVVPTDPATQEQAFGIGWYKYAPDIAEKLLIKNGFKRDKNKNWLLPSGQPWKIQFLMNVSITTTLGCRNGVAAVQQWKKFGIDAETYSNQAVGTMAPNGDFDVVENWPAQEPWGAGPDLYRTLDYYNSAYIKPLGTLTQGHPSRWSSKDMDDVIKKLRGTNPADYAATVGVGTEGLKILVRDMPGIPTFGYIGFVGWDQTYWTNWPGSDNPYTQPYCHWGPFKYMTPFLKPTGA
jgi:peptide/nickel transport system substrate-binding protein